MKQPRNSCFSSRAACMALVLCGLVGFLGLESTGEAQASPSVQSQSIASGNRVGASGYAVILVGRGSNDSKRCPRSNDGCEKDLPPLPPTPAPPQQ